MSKKFFTLILAIVLVTCPLLVSCGEGNTDTPEFSVTEATASIDYSKYEGITLDVFNWGEYISDGSEGSVDVNAEFTKLTGIKVNYTNFTSNEDMYNKIVNGGVTYDIIIPSDYMIEKMISENRLHPINFDNIPNYKYISEDYRDLSFDPENKYSVPYNVGMVGLIYNKALVETAPDSWNALWDENYDGEILMFNNPRDAFGIAQFLLGTDINSENEADWNAAKNKLLEQKPLVKQYVMDEIFNKMESGAAALAPYYAGDFFSMYENNNDLGFVYPKEGTNIFVDSICIPKESKKKEAAELYINFLLDPQVALQNAYMICYASPNTAVAENEEYRAYLDELHPEAYNILYNNMTDYYEGVNVKDYYFRNLSDKTLENMNDLWSDLKIETTDDGSGNYIIYACLGILAVIVAVFILSKVRKAKREKDYDSED